MSINRETWLSRLPWNRITRAFRILIDWGLATKALRRLHVLWVIKRYPIPDSLWHQACAKLPLLHEFTAVEKARLRELAILFMHGKTFSGAQGLALTDEMCLMIAVQASIPVLGLGYHCLTGWREVIVYPQAFRISRDECDSAGVVHHTEKIALGEAWARGPLILAWSDIEQDAALVRTGRNVVIHEIAHKLDMLNGPADGFPPLHSLMDLKQWTVSLGSAYKKLVGRVERGQSTCINSYAAESPGEFFAVVSEVFFCAPQLLQSHFPDVFRQLQFYYRHYPLARQ